MSNELRIGPLRTERPSETRSSRATARLVIAGRLMLFLLAGCAAVSGFVLSRGGGQEASGIAERYTCPMHPEVVSSRPDECPVCRMALEQVSTAEQDVRANSSNPEALPAESANSTVVATAKRQIFAVEVRAPAWVGGDGLVTAVLYKDEAAGLLPGEQGLFFRAAAPSAGIAVRAAAEPPAPWDESTSQVRFHLDPGAPQLPPGEVGWLTVAPRPRGRLVVPAGAVLYSSQGPYVLIEGPDGHTFTKRSVGIGRVYRGLAVVLSGLRDEERVAAANTFFLDAERRLQSLRQESLETPTGGVAR